MPSLTGLDGASASVAEPVTNGKHEQTPGHAPQQNPGASDLDASRLEYTLTKSPRAIPGPDSSEMWSQGWATDHMILARYDAGKGGWQAPQLVPYGPISLMPTASTLHYATECFEGMKLYRGNDGRARLFRPDRNAQRMVTSAARVSLPEFPSEELVKLVGALAAVDAPRWMPANKPGGFLYVRPTFIATQPSLAIKKASEALLYVMLICFPEFDKVKGETKKTRLRLLASGSDMVRAWPGGFGGSKVGANYGPSIVASNAASDRGFDQILWLFGPNNHVTEVGTSNFFAVIRPRGSTDRPHLITAPLGDDIILPGVTRGSILEMARDVFKAELDVWERNLPILELVEAADEGRLLECFVCGTAFFVTPIGEIRYQDRSIVVPPGKDGFAGEFATQFRARLAEIMQGDVQHPWGFKIEESGEELRTEGK